MKLDLNFYARDTKSMKIIMNLRDIYCFNWLLKFQETTWTEKLVGKQLLNN